MEDESYEASILQALRDVSAQYTALATTLRSDLEAWNAAIRQDTANSIKTLVLRLIDVQEVIHLLTTDVQEMKQSLIMSAEAREEAQHRLDQQLDLFERRQNWQMALIVFLVVSFVVLSLAVVWLAVHPRIV